MPSGLAASLSATPGPFLSPTLSLLIVCALSCTFLRLPLLPNSFPLQPTFPLLWPIFPGFSTLSLHPSTPTSSLLSIDTDTDMSASATYAVPISALHFVRALDHVPPGVARAQTGGRAAHRCQQRCAPLRP